jgi:hypothetical protein
MRRLAALIALPALALLAGCGEQSEPAGRPQPAATASTTSAAPKAADEYDGAQRLVGGLNEAGIACLNWERTENPIGALERGSCYIGTEEIIASIYSSDEAAADEPEQKAALLGGASDVIMVVGGNWTLSCDVRELCEQIAQKFGGTMTYLPA